MTNCSSDTSRFFYHSFPRPRAGRDADKVGLRILDSICENGLLLVPEAKTWTIPSVTPQRENTIVQHRTCFTELHPSELKEHASHFGNFAIEYGLEELISLGAMPVNYVPLSKENAHAPYGVAAVTIMNDVVEVAKFLKSLARFIPHSEDQKFTFAKIGGGTLEIILPWYEQMGLANLIRGFQCARGRDVDGLAEALTTMLTLWYPSCDDSIILRYYRQREWRIVPLRHLGGQDLSPANNEQLTAIDPDFFKPDSSKKDYYFFKGDASNEVLRMANRIITPSHLVKESKEILDRHGIALPVVSIDEL